MKDSKAKAKKSGGVSVMALIIILIIAIAIITIVINKSKKPNVDVAKNNDTSVTTENKEAGEYTTVLDDGTKLNTSSKLKEAKEVDGLKFENIQLTEQGNQTVLLADVTNTTSKKTGEKLVTVKLLDKDGNEIITVKGMIQPLEAGAKGQFNTSMTLDYSDAYDFEISVEDE